MERDDVLGADPGRDNYLYQIWIFFELADLLATRGRLVRLDTKPGSMCMEFRWGDDDRRRQYELRHDQAVPDPVVQWGATPVHGTVPGVRPDFYLRRVDPPPQLVQDDTYRYWREPGVIWDAKYYRERENDRAPSSPVKRMIADLQILGEQHGALLFAYLMDNTNVTMNEAAVVSADRAISAGESDDTIDGHGASLAYVISPLNGYDQTVVPDQKVGMWHLRPEGDVEIVRARLESLLRQAHERLNTPRVPRCFGVFLDTLSAAGQQALVDRYGTEIGAEPDELVLCPKPHIGPWRVDLVSRRLHCCEDGRLCQIIGQPDRRKPIRPPRTPEELLKEMQHIFAEAGLGEMDEEKVVAIARQVETMTRRYAEIVGITPKLYLYYNRLRDLGMQDSLENLGDQERESLALALYLVDQVDQVGTQDYSAPAIHISSVIELEVQRRVFRCPELEGALAKPTKQTLGVLPFIRWKPEESEGNWERIVAYVDQHWHGHIDKDDSEHEVTFDAFVKALDPISKLRNKAAHPHPLSRDDYSKLQRVLLQSGPLGTGALNALLLAWR